jgi:hypothetical protein
MMYKAKVTLCFEIRTKHSAQNEHHLEYSVVNLMARK